MFLGQRSVVRLTLLPLLAFSFSVVLFSQQAPAPVVEQLIRPGLVRGVGTMQHASAPSLRELSEMPAPLAPLPRVRQMRPRQPVTFKNFNPGAMTEEDPTLQTTALLPPQELAPTVSANFEGLGAGFGGFTVTTVLPHTTGAVGLTQYVQWVNFSWVVFDKTSHTALGAPVPGNAIFTNLGGLCAAKNWGVPTVLYDKFANRWLLMQMAPTTNTGGLPIAPFNLCFAISTGPDAWNSTYELYSVSFSDYEPTLPRMGVWSDGYYMAYDMADPNANYNLVGTKFFAVDRFAMLNAKAANYVYFTYTTNNEIGVLPADIDGSTLPPTGSPEYFATLSATGGMTVDLFKFHADYQNFNNATLTGPVPTTVSNFTPLCFNGTSWTLCIPQSGTTQLLFAPVADRPMHRVAYRNYGDHEAIAVSHDINVSCGASCSSAGVRWYEIRNPGGTPTLTQQSTFTPDNAYRWTSSIAMDRAGNMALGYNVSSASMHPAIAVTGRLSTDTANTMQAETTVVTGGGSYTDSRGNWGPWSAMTVDPVDDCTFWYTNEYMASNGVAWNTRIASMKFPTCGANNGTALRFVPSTPCRIADTRNANGPLGGPFLSGNAAARSFPVPSSACGIPSNAQAYSLNVTVVPHGGLGYLTMFPCGQPQPFVSTLNSLDGRIKAVASILPAGTSGSVCAFATNDTDLVLDINGYFITASDPSAPLAFFPVPPCRLVDTRNSNGPLGGPMLNANTSRTFPLLSGSCGIPGTAKAYSLNFTVVPQGALGYLTTWPTGQSQPFVSTLNALTGAIAANAAIVPAGTSGSVDVFVTNNTHLVVDINGYFAPMTTGGLSLYNVPPCRVLDTRIPGNSPAVNGEIDPNLGANICVPTSAAKAFVVNATVVPQPTLGYLTLWPQGVNQPVVSTLNATDGAITSNMAIVPTNNGSVSAFTSNPSHIVLDVSGYFAP